MKPMSISFAWYSPTLICGIVFSGQLECNIIFIRVLIDLSANNVEKID